MTDAKQIEAAREFVAYVERKWSGGTGHTANNRWVSHAELRKHVEAFAEEQAIWQQADEQCAFDPTPNPAQVAAIAGDGPAADRVIGPVEYEGFQGCTDQNPDACACATHEDPGCSACGEAIEAGDYYYVLNVPLPWMQPEHPDQEWGPTFWHATCDLRALLSDPASEEGDRG